MKKIIILITILSIVTVNYGQKKILFDNTKSETAGNADWIIDDTQPVPSPAQSGITSSSDETYWSGALSAWGVEMVKRGYYVETLPSSGSITYGNSSNTQDLSNYDVFVVCEPNNPFNSTEKQALIDFVYNGGGLFIVSDHAIADRDGDGWDALEVWNDFFSDYSNPFGFTVDVGSNVSKDPATNVANLPSNTILHGAAGDVDGIAFYNGATFTIDNTANSSAVGLVYMDGYSNTGTTGVMAVYATYGSGKVVAVGDSSVPEDETAHDNSHTYPGWYQPFDAGNATGDDGVFMTNATIWLAENSTNPYLNVSANSLVNFNYLLGNGPSTSQSFSLSGSNLDGSQVSVTASTNYEVSLNNSTFSTSVNVSYTGETLSATTVYVRLKSGLSKGTYNGTIVCDDNGTASNKTVTLSGEVTNTPLFCDDFQDNLNDWTVTNDSDPGAEITISSTFAGANTTSYSAVFDCPNPSSEAYFTSYIEKTFDNSQNLSINFWYYFEDYRGGEITVYVNNVEVYSIYTDGDGDFKILEANTDKWNEINLDLSSVTSTSGNYTIKIEGVSKASSTWKDRVAIDELCVFGDLTNPPSLSVSPTTISGFTYVAGSGPSTSQSFSLSGSNLDGSEITISAPTNYEVSKDNSSFSASVNVAYSGSTLSATTIYVRLKAGLSAGNYNNELVTCSDNGTASNKNITVNGQVSVYVNINSNEKSEISIYPNPVTNNRITISTDNSSEKQIIIYSLSGKIIKTDNFSSQNKEIELSNLNSGIYFIKIMMNNSVNWEKIIVE